MKRATEVLVKAAQQTKDYNDDESSLSVNKRMVEGIAEVRFEFRCFLLVFFFNLTMQLKP